MPRNPKLPAPPVAPARTPAAHIQSAIARTAQAKMAAGNKPPLQKSPHHIPPRAPAPHVQSALRAVQAKLPDKPLVVQPASDLKGTPAAAVDFLDRLTTMGANNWLHSHEGQVWESALHGAPKGKRVVRDYKSEDKKKEIAPDIALKYNPRKACVLQSLIYVKKDVWGKKNAKDLHDAIWKSHPEYKQYSDDSIMDTLYAAAGMTKVSTHNGKKAEALAEELSAGTYLVAIGGSSEDHVVILTDGGWIEYDQLGGRGFKEANVSKAAVVTAVYVP